LSVIKPAKSWHSGTKVNT